MVSAVVEKTYAFEVSAFVEITLCNGEVIRCTASHPFVTKHKGLCAVNPDGSHGTLCVGDPLVTSGDADIEITRIKQIIDTVLVYTLDLKDDFYYYFTHGVLTHNAGF